MTPWCKGLVFGFVFVFCPRHVTRDTRYPRHLTASGQSCLMTMSFTVMEFTVNRCSPLPAGTDDDS